MNRPLVFALKVLSKIFVIGIFFVLMPKISERDLLFIDGLIVLFFMV